jgi:hypothetical protein
VVLGGVLPVMDRHLVEAFKPLTDLVVDILADKVAQRLGLRPPVKAVDRSSVAAPPDTGQEPSSAATEYLDTKQLAKLMGVSVGGLENMRRAGTGPKFVHVGRNVRYPTKDLK